MFAVFGLLNFDAPHGIPFIVGVLPLFRKLLQFAGVILRQLDFFQQLLAEMGFGYTAHRRAEITEHIPRLTLCGQVALFHIDNFGV
ncbi:hypothetical protein C4A25_04362 [Escherichia coli]|nr:hypothetical protein C4A25_04362 [Escherichia coli]